MRWVIVAPAVIWAIIRVPGLDSWYPMVQLIAFTPYVAALSIVPLALTVLWRQWNAAVVAGIATIALAICVLPRGVQEHDTIQGRQLTIMTVNVLAGTADPQAVLKLAEAADVLVVQELTPSFSARIAPHFPYMVAYPAKGVGGSGIYARVPLRDLGLRMNPEGFGQANAELTDQHVFLESVHPVAPSEQNRIGPWRESFRRQRSATPDGPMWILAGDFNATLDHSVLRDLINTGYRDAASTVGQGFTGTWGPYDGDPIPPVTLDRVLADKRIGIKSAAVAGVKGSDHRAFMAVLAVP